MTSTEPTITNIEMKRVSLEAMRNLATIVAYSAAATFFSTRTHTHPLLAWVISITLGLVALYATTFTTEIFIDALHRRFSSTKKSWPITVLTYVVILALGFVPVIALSTGIFK
jgi:hypothetical protein